jgi:hypothetical protein
VSGDLHSPTNAGPTPEPTPAASFDGPYSTAGASAAERPEVLVGAAFAGGLITAMLLKRLGR